jgi:glycosyltransferase involved in cell wall biosynthesis
LDSFAEIAPKISRACLTLLGEGPQEQNLRKKVQQYGISNQVRFISWLPHEEAISLIQKCNVLLFPSMEGGGMVVLEALAAGKPVVSLDCGGPGEFVNNECGIKIPLTHRARSVRDLSRALQTLANQPDLRRCFAEGARRRVMDFTWEKKGEFIDRIYSEIGKR